MGSQRTGHRRLCRLAVALALGAACQPFGGDSDPPEPTADGGHGDANASPNQDGGGPPDADDARPTTYREVVLADAPIAYWRLGETAGAGTLRSEIDDDHHLVPSEVEMGAPGAIANDSDTSAELLKSESRLEAESPDLFDFVGNAPFSLEVWFRAKTIDGTERYLISKMADGDAGYGIFVSTPTSGATGLVFERRIDGERRFAAIRDPSISLDTWHHAAATFDGQALAVYLDGARQIWADTDRALPSILAPLVVGAEPDGGGGSFLGGLDEIAIYDHALSTDRVRLHWAVGSGASGDR